MKQPQNIVVTRAQLGQWFSVIGGISLVFGMLALLLQGGTTPYILAALVIGAVSIALWAYLAPNEFRDFIAGRQVRYGTAALFSTLLLAGIVVLGYSILERANLSLDMTEGRRFSLSRETQEVLRRVSRPLVITGFYRQPEELRERDFDDQYFKRYETTTEGKIRWQFIDPVEEPGVAARFTQTYGVITYPDNIFLSFLNPDSTLDFPSTTRVARAYNEDGSLTTQERDMTQAILRLLYTGAFTVYFETSHGEFDTLASDQQGLSVIHSIIQQNGMITQELRLSDIAVAGGSIPDDASVIVMARPTSPLSSAEIAILDAYLQRGGTLLILADVLFNDNPFLAQNSEFNTYLWNNFGIRALDAAIVDPGASSQTALDIVSYQVFTDTPLGINLNVEGDLNSAVQFHIARALELNDTPPVPNGRVILTSPQSYGETNLQALREGDTYQFDEGVDIPGPFSTVVWATNQATGSKIVVIGDGDFITNGYSASPLGNITLFMDSLVWLTGFGEQVTFQPTAFTTGLPVFASAQTLDLVAFLTVIVQPGIVLIIGLAMWLRRVRR